MLRHHVLIFQKLQKLKTRKISENQILLHDFNFPHFQVFWKRYQNINMNLNFSTSDNRDAPHRVPFDMLFLFWSAFPTPDRRPISQCRRDAFEAGHNRLVCLDLWSSSLLPVKQKIFSFSNSAARHLAAPPSSPFSVLPSAANQSRSLIFVEPIQPKKYKEPAKRDKKTEVPTRFPEKNPKASKTSIPTKEKLKSDESNKKQL